MSVRSGNTSCSWIPQVNALAWQLKTLGCRPCFSVTCSQASAAVVTSSVSEKRRGQMNYCDPMSSSLSQYDQQFHCDLFVQNQNKWEITSSGLNCALSEPGWMWWFLCSRIYSLRGVGIDRKAKEGGVGDWRELVWGYGDGQLSSIPQGTACYAKQNQSFSKKQEVICQPQQTLSVSPSPTTPPTPHLL